MDLTTKNTVPPLTPTEDRSYLARSLSIFSWKATKQFCTSFTQKICTYTKAFFSFITWPITAAYNYIVKRPGKRVEHAHLTLASVVSKSKNMSLTDQEKTYHSTLTTMVSKSKKTSRVDIEKTLKNIDKILQKNLKLNCEVTFLIGGDRLLFSVKKDFISQTNNVISSDSKILANVDFKDTGFRLQIIDRPEKFSVDSTIYTFVELIRD